VVHVQIVILMVQVHVALYDVSLSLLEVFLKTKS
jgi:hypothetical protein